MQNYEQQGCTTRLIAENMLIWNSSRAEAFKKPARFNRNSRSEFIP